MATTLDKIPWQKLEIKKYSIIIHTHNRTRVRTDILLKPATAHYKKSSDMLQPSCGNLESLWAYLILTNFVVSLQTHTLILNN